MRLQDKVAIISGGGRGMGAVEAKLFASEGARVIIGDILESEGLSVESQITKAGGEAVFIRLDVTKQNDWDSVVSGAVEHFGKIDILVNNAGIALFGTLEDTSDDDWDRVMDVNAKGVFLGTKAVISEMRKNGCGSIINISSVSGLIGQPTVQPVYNASKGAVRIFTKAAAVQYAKQGIRVNSVHPGSVDTLMISHRIDTPEAQQRRNSLTPLGRVAQPIEIAYGVLYLASDEASFVTGSELVIDGGFTAQ